MSKLLTVSVAAYNMEGYLRRTLESLALPGAIDALEVFVVDDGSSDATLSIAREYQRRYPGSFFAIHKENGGYGSTINWSLAHATGRYFRPLDGDDWFDPRGLRSLLTALAGTDADAVYTPNWRVRFRDGAEVSRKLAGAAMKATRFSEIPDARALGMHRLTYRTDVLRAAQLRLPLHTYYADTIYACAPMSVARTILPLDCPLYCLRLGRPGQSLSIEMRAAHLDDALRVALLLGDCCGRQRRLGGANLRQMEEFTAYLYRSALRLLLRAPLDRRYLIRLRRFDAEMRKRSPEIHFDAGRRGKLGLALRLLRRTDYRVAPALHPLFVRFIRRP